VNPKPKSKSSVLPTFRGTKNSKKIPAKNVTDPSDEETVSGQDPPHVFMATVVCSYQAPAFRASDSPAAWMVRRSLTDSLATVGAVVGGEFDVIGVGMASWRQLRRVGPPHTKWGAATPEVSPKDDGHQRSRAGSRPVKNDCPWSGYMQA
jgi:hypothetical protein